MTRMRQVTINPCRQCGGELRVTANIDTQELHETHVPFECKNKQECVDAVEFAIFKDAFDNA